MFFKIQEKLLKGVIFRHGNGWFAQGSKDFSIINLVYERISCMKEVSR